MLDYILGLVGLASLIGAAGLAAKHAAAGPDPGDAPPPPTTAELAAAAARGSLAGVANVRKLDRWSVDKALASARKLVGLGLYILGTGGRAPNTSEPWTIKRILGIKRKGSDCIGFVLWCLGLDRFQPTFPFYGGWINTDSAIADARHAGVFFKLVKAADVALGDLVVFPSINIDDDAARERIGHVGMIVEILPGYVPGRFDLLRVIHCASRPRGKPAVRESDATTWAGRDRFKFGGKTHQNDAWGSVFIRATHLAAA